MPNDMLAGTQLADDCAAYNDLCASGRYVEQRVPLDGGKRHIIVGAYYGVSGSTSMGAEYKENERLLQEVQQLRQEIAISGDF